MSAKIDFSPINILSADGNWYRGVRPSLVLKPFISVFLVLGGKVIPPGLPKGYSPKDAVDFDVAARMGMSLNAGGSGPLECQGYRMVAIFKDGKRWSKLIYLNGIITENWL